LGLENVSCFCALTAFHSSYHVECKQTWFLYEE
jgi:hypothetical protein